MANWFGLPKRGDPHYTFRDVRVRCGGKRWTATWHVEDGRLHVSSAWGSRAEPIGRRKDLARRAEQLLEEIVSARPEG